MNSFDLIFLLLWAFFLVSAWMRGPVPEFCELLGLALGLLAAEKAQAASTGLLAPTYEALGSFAWVFYLLILASGLALGQLAKKALQPVHQKLPPQGAARHWSLVFSVGKVMGISLAITSLVSRFYVTGAAELTGSFFYPPLAALANLLSGANFA